MSSHTLSVVASKNPVAATAVEKSADAKLGKGKMSALHVSQYGCPTDCPFFPKDMPEFGGTWDREDLKCYANSGPELLTAIRLNSAPVKSPTAIARDAVASMAKLTGRRVLRLMVVGDFRTNRSARMISKAAAAHTAKHGQPTFAYTHAWRTVLRRAWSTVNIRASVHSEQDVRDARAAGYTLALAYTTPTHTPLTHSFYFAGEKFVPCPQQNGRSADCASCGLCYKTDLNIAFAGHNRASDGTTNGQPLVVIPLEEVK